MIARLCPVSLRQAKAFVAAHHRHSDPPRGWKFGVGLESEAGDLLGVAIAGRPESRELQARGVLEVTRVCAVGHRNACSLLYGAIARAAEALGWSELCTYTLAEEPGASLRAAGWEPQAELRARRGGSAPSRPRAERDLFGNERVRSAARVRWTKALRRRALRVEVGIGSTRDPAAEEGAR